MERVKVFYGCNDAEGLEQRINAWLDKMGDKIEITRTMQDASGRLDHDVTITIFYKTK
ncbi:MAG: hypothetical protein HYT93_02065 [Parcubacteria group bacterium]|nr:hypothetical protein [Parcubacteria group bacterium]